MSANEQTSIAAAIVEDICAALPGVVPDFVRRELDAVAREAFPRIQIWKHDFVLSTRAGRSDYAVDPRVPGARVAEVLAVSYGAAPLRMHQPPLTAVEDPAAPRYWWMPTPGVLRLHPAPRDTAIAAVGVRAALSPLNSITAAPEEILVPMRELLFLGTQARLYPLPGKPWTALPLAQRSRKMYRIELAKLQAEYLAGTSQGGAEWQFPGGWGSRHG